MEEYHWKKCWYLMLCCQTNKKIMTEKYLCQNLDDLPLLALTLINKYPQHLIFAFWGEMGVGKTTFIKQLCKTLGVKEEITTSPSFAIVNEYQGAQNKTIYHFDFFRIKNITEAYDIGYEDYFFSGNYCFIEWPEKIETLLPENSINVKISEQNNIRIFEF